MQTSVKRRKAILPLASNRINKKSREPLPPKLAALVREAKWLVLVAAALYLLLVLMTYDKTDPAWSHDVGSSDVQNAGGVVGAWLADVMLYIFGLSAYWWAVFCLYSVWWGYKRIERVEQPPTADRRPLPPADRRPFFVAAIGLFVLLFASCGLEALRFHSFGIALPLQAGGMAGVVIGSGLSTLFGYTGAMLILIVLGAIGISLLTGLSWLNVTERIGGAIEDAWLAAVARWQNRKDRRLGKLALEKREGYLAEGKKRSEAHEPVVIQAPPPEPAQSIRVQREKQAPLFEDLPDSELPPLHLLDQPTHDAELLSPETLEFTSRLIEKKLLDFGVEVKVVAAYPGPVITRYEIEPAIGVKGSQIVNLVKDLARALSVVSIRVVETIPGKSCMGLEIPNPRRQIVRLSEILNSTVYADNPSPLTLAMGKDIGGHPVVADLARMPHVLVAGTTGSGKSVALNAMILSLLYKASPAHVRLIMVDPKMLELSVYEGIPHLLTPVVTDMKQAAAALNWCVAEMERRYKLMSTLGVRNLAGYNQKIRDAEKAGMPLRHPRNPLMAAATDADGEASPQFVEPELLQQMPLIVVVIDELADLMMVVGKKVEELIARLAQKARAAGLHLILATQRPSVDVITGLIKANIPTRVAFQVSAKVDSRTILDQMGAEALLGQGDMLYLPPGTGYPQRVHGAFVADQEVHRVVEYLKSLGAPQYVDGIIQSGEGELEEAALEDGNAESDALYDEAVAIVLKSRRASISLVQRHLRIGYNRAARLIEQMERAGMVSAMQNNGNREVLVPPSEQH
ncbi:MAG: DNA translocase FtsK 4TM domain-containing protein [Burkholderiales bacterium]|nr:DNA translocase FtsK 4TM domain-containing protein [Burkholderiales bacterium]